MLYKILKILAQLSFKLYFRRIFIYGNKNIPKKGSVIFLVNHPNSFLEACIIAAYQHRDLHFLVRGDMFEKKWLLPILIATYQIPIFRFKDGFSKLRNNKSTFDQSFQVIAEGNALLLFPEASSLLVKYLRPLQKGASRLALGTIEEKNVNELYVIPTCVYYIDPTKSRNDVIINFGEAIDMITWYQQNKELEDKLTPLTAFFQSKMEASGLSIGHINHEKLYDQIYEITEKEIIPFNASGLIQDYRPYLKMSNFLKSINNLPEKQLIEIEALIKNYASPIGDLKAIDASVSYSVSEKFIILLKMFVCFCVGLTGFMVYGIPLIFSKIFAKHKIKHIEFYAPVRIAISMLSHIVFSIIIIALLNIYYTIPEIIIIFIFLQFSLFSFGLFLDFSKYTKYFFLSHIRQNNKEFLKKRQTIIASTKLENYFEK